MSISLTDMLRRLARLRGWAALVTLAGLVLVGLYGYLGYQYWNSYGHIAELTQQQQVLTTTRPAAQNVEALQAEIAFTERQLEQVRSRFIHPESDGLLAILSATAQQANVALIGVDVGMPTPDLVLGMGYVMQPMTIDLEAKSRADLFAFFDLLSVQVPVADVTSIRMGGFGSAPWAKADVRFFTDPEPQEPVQTLAQPGTGAS